MERHPDPSVHERERRPDSLPGPDPLRIPALTGQSVLLGVTGSIAAYKAAELASRLVQAGARVEVAMTRSATRFIAPLTFQALTHRPVLVDLFAPELVGVEHVQVARRVKAVLIAPASADTISRLAQGRADDALTTIVLSTTAPVLVAPAMEENMYRHPATQENLARLRERGVVVVEPERGRLASGLRGEGRLASLPRLLGALRHVLGRSGDLAGCHLVVTAGGTREPLDPVRVLTNRSSGKMGTAIAHAARDRGARVTLITAAPPPEDAEGIRVVPVQTALEMAEAVGQALQDPPGCGADALIMAAAVADYRPSSAYTQKRKKEGAPGEAAPWTLELVANPDILNTYRGPYLRVGFAAETHDVAAHAQAKLKAKDLDWIVANDVSRPDSGFDVDTNRVTLYSRDGQFIPLPLLSKLEVADRILDCLAPRLQARGAAGGRPPGTDGELGNAGGGRG